MFGHIPLDIILLFMLYAGGAAVAAIACIYLLLRRANAFAPDVTSPVRLRRWTAIFFASLVLGHLWYLPSVMFTSSDDIMMSLLVGALLDCLTAFPLAIVVLLCMLQDRRRPLWLAWVLVVPLVAGIVACMVTRSEALMPMLRLYLLVMGIGLFIYMVHAVRQYRRWLRDNYADLENKEVWQSFVVLAAILLVFGIYASGDEGMTYEYVIQVCGIVLVCHLLWRVETLSDLSISQTLPLPVEEETTAAKEEMEDDTLSETTRDDIGPLLQKYCVDTKLYLQHDLTVTQLAQAIGSNRTYLGQYFSSQDTTYNAYINNLRIHHFINLYREAVAAQRPFTAQQLANHSGYRSYSTFSLAFKQRMGQSVTAWMRETTA